MMKDRLQKKFYKTNSENHKLAEITKEIKSLNYAKELILDEYSNSNKIIDEVFFDQKEFINILNALRVENNKERQRLGRYSKKMNDLLCNKNHKQTLSEQCGEKLKNQKKILEQRLFKIQRNSIINQRLEYKEQGIYNDIMIIKERIFVHRKIEKVRNRNLNRIKETKISSELKKNDSMSFLQFRQKQMNKLVSISRNNLIVKNLDYKRQSELKNVLFDKAAKDKLDYLKMDQQKQNLSSEIEYLKKNSHRLNNKENKIKTQTKEDILNPIIKTVEEQFGSETDLLATVNITEEDCECPIVNKIILFFKILNISIDKNHKLLEILSLHREKKKQALNNKLRYCTQISSETPKHKKFIHKPENFETNYYYLQNKTNCIFLYETNNFMSFFGRRISRLISAFNKNCQQLNIDIRIKLDPLFLNEQITKSIDQNTRDVPDIRLGGLNEHKEINTFLYDEAEQEMLNSGYNVGTWFAKIFPSFGKYNIDVPFGEYFINHFLKILFKIKSLKKCLTHLKEGLSENEGQKIEFKTKKASIASSSMTKLRLNKLKREYSGQDKRQLDKKASGRNSLYYHMDNKNILNEVTFAKKKQLRGQKK